MKKLLLFFIPLFFFAFALNAQESHAPNEVKVIIIRKGSIAGSANKWKLWLNGEELCKIKNSSYCETTVATDSLSFVGKYLTTLSQQCVRQSREQNKANAITDYGASCYSKM